MFSGGRLFILAIAGLALVGAAPKQGDKESGKNSKAESNTGGGAQAVARQSPEAIKIAESPVHERACQKGSDNRESDLCAQWKAADAASEAAWWAMIATFVTALGTFGLFWQIKLTREAVQDTGDATAQMARQTKLAEAAQRPYLHVESMGWQKINASQNFIFLLKIKNYGQTPARAFSISADIKFSIKNKPPKLWRMRECSVSDLMPQTKSYDIVVVSSDSRINKFGIADNCFYEDSYCRFELRYKDSFGNEYGLFETYCQRHHKTGIGEEYRFVSTP